jgi:hypothetical protein
LTILSHTERYFSRGWPRNKSQDFLFEAEPFHFRQSDRLQSGLPEFLLRAGIEEGGLPEFFAFLFLDREFQGLLEPLEEGRPVRVDRIEETALDARFDDLPVDGFRSTLSRKSKRDEKGPPAERAVKISSTAALPMFFTPMKP